VTHPLSLEIASKTAVATGNCPRTLQPSRPTPFDEGLAGMAARLFTVGVILKANPARNIWRFSAIT
jgi:hypothetical protein